MALTWTEKDIAIVFGVEANGRSLEECAKVSARKFVRSQIQVGYDNERAKGRKISASEALDTLGGDIMHSLVNSDVTSILWSADEPGRTVELRRKEMSLGRASIAQVLNIDEDTLKDFESGKLTLPFRMLEKIGRILVLDELLLGVEPGAGGDPALGVRLREFNGDLNRNIRAFTSQMVMRLSESAWVVKKQNALQAKIGRTQSDIIRDLGIKPSDDYRFRTWERGFELASRTRHLLGYEPTAPVESMRELVEERLNIPVVQWSFNPKFAGATVSSGGDDRGVVLNVDGQNKNVWVRRNTLAHELGHLLWDPAERLNKLVVDEFSDFDELQNAASNSQKRDPVELRANAFAVEFIAPRKGVVNIFNDFTDPSEGIRNVMDHYGVSFTAAKWQLFNAGVIKQNERFHEVDVQPSDEWKAREDYVIDYFPIESVPYSRRGKFVKVVIDAYRQGFLSLDSAASCLECTSEEFARFENDMYNYYA